MLIKHPSYLDGVIECEKLWDKKYHVREICEIYREEERILSGDYRWKDWLDGFMDCLVHKIKNRKL